MTDKGASPSDLLGTGDRFVGWYPGQRDLLLECLNWYYSPDQFLGISLPTGCHAKGQGILMYDGSIKRVEDVVVGDLLMGADSVPRRVQSLHRSFGDMFMVVPVKGKSFRVNADHVLSLVCTNMVGESSTKRGTNGVNGGLFGGEVRDVSVRDVLRFSRSRHHVSKLFRVAVDFPDRGCELPISPYVLGLLLGDGCLGGKSRTGRNVGISLTSCHRYLELEREAERFGLVVRVVKKSGTTALAYNLSMPHNCPRGVTSRNMLGVALASLDLLGTRSGSKFIPIAYKTSSRQDRLELIAGLVDTDGCLTSGGFDFVSKSEVLANDFAFVCRSVGLAAYIRPSVKGCGNFNGIYYRVSVSGDCSVVPCRFKRASVRQQKKSVLRTGFKIFLAGEDYYYGFHLDGDGRYLLDDFTVTHNSGKSLIALLTSKLTNTRTIILTATKGLSHQYLADAKDIGGVEVKGRNNFRCLLNPDFTAEDGVCNLGIVCDLRDQCPYRLQLDAARKSQLVITNYAYWLAQTNYTNEGLGPVGLLISDESHLAFSALEGFLTVFISRADIHPLGITFPVTDPDQRQQGWRVWAESAKEVASAEASKLGSEVRSVRKDKGIPSAPLVRAARRANGLVSKLGLLSGINEQWVVQWTQSGCRFVPKWVAHHSEDLFHTESIPKIILMSAILSHRTADYLGVPEDRAWVEADSYFPAENTQIWHIPTARINYRTGDMETRMWVSRIDQIIQRRLDRKGIVFTVSYERARLLLSRSRFKDIMLAHSTGDVVQVVEQFKKSPPPVVLVSPSVTTGYDFPEAVCGFGKPQYLIVGKIPYGDTSEPVTKARHEEDKEWTSYQAMETLIQESGRVSRSAEDKAEVFVVDDNIGWFMKRYGLFAPAWFRERYRGSMDTVPNPLV